MKPPGGLNAAGRAAWHNAADACLLQPHPVERFRRGIDRYAIAVDIAARIRAEWVGRKRPILAKGGTTGRVAVGHPLIAMIAEAERNAARFGGCLGLDPRSAKKLGALPGRPQERVVPRAERTPEAVAHPSGEPLTPPPGLERSPGGPPNP